MNAPVAFVHVVIEALVRADETPLSCFKCYKLWCKYSTNDDVLLIGTSDQKTPVFKEGESFYPSERVGILQTNRKIMSFFLLCVDSLCISIEHKVNFCLDFCSTLKVYSSQSVHSCG